MENNEFKVTTEQLNVLLNFIKVRPLEEAIGPYQIIQQILRQPVVHKVEAPPVVHEEPAEKKKRTRKTTK